MPARGGAFFGFAIVVLVALVTWGIIALVEVAEDNNSSSDSGDFADSRDVDSDLQALLDDASPGDTIYIPAGTHDVSLTTVVDGTEDEPITIRNEIGTSVEDCVLRGDDRARVLEVLHNHYIIQGFTIDGDDGSGDYKEQLLYIEGSRDPSEVDGVDSSITGVNVQGMVLKNAGKECLRMRYFATNCVVQVNEIGPCGIEDFQQDSDGSNGEGVYIGTALNQIDEKNGDDVVDECTGNVVMNNEIDTQGSEGVDIKEGSYGNVVYGNTIRGQMDEETGGISIRGDENIVVDNHVIDGSGTCIRIGGFEEDGVQYGEDNEVYENTLDGCLNSAVKVNESPQLICDNTVILAADPADDDLYAMVRGDAAEEFTDTVTAECTGDKTVFFLPDHYTPPDDEEVETTDDEDTTDDGGDQTGVVASDSYEYIGCYNDDTQTSLLPVLAIDDDDNMSVEKCIAACVAEGSQYAGIKEGNECRCGDDVDYTLHGTGTCNFSCTGSDETVCGGEFAFDLYEIHGDGGVDGVVSSDTDDQGDDTGGVGSDEENETDTSSNHDTTDGYTESVVVVQGDDDEDEDPESVDDDDDTVLVTGGTHVGCYGDDDKDPILKFLYEDEDTLTPASCIESCREEDEELAGVQGGDQCWCGTTDEYTRYGTGTCNFSCSGDSEQTCGGNESANVWTVD